MVKTSQRPNLLLILSDQHARNLSGFAGDPHLGTQNLDRLATRSVQFDTAICPVPVCTPSRMCMLTGKDAHRCAAWNNHWVIFPEHTTWPAYFAQNGYSTCLVGKMHFGGRNQMQGFQVRPYGDLRHGLSHQPEPLELFPGYAHAKSAGVTEIPESLIQDMVVTRETLAFLLEHRDAEPETPWFVCASYSRPHSPFTAPGRYIRRYRGTIPPVELPENHRELLDPYSQTLSEHLHMQLTPEESLKGREAYYACIDFVDDCIGDLLDGLGKVGLLENTIVIYTSDHGEMAGLHGLWGKGLSFEPSIGVPLLISGPGIRTQQRVAYPVSLLDLYPTACALAGLPVPEGLDGIDFSDVLQDPDAANSPRDYAPSACYQYGVRVKGAWEASEWEPHGAMRLLRGKDWKYVEIEGADPLLFDMVGDPGETKNLAGDADQALRCQEMKRALFRGFSWEKVHTQLAEDRDRLPQFFSGLKPSTPNQYMLQDGRIFDAEASLYKARWLHIPPEANRGIIPQQFG